MQSLEQDGSSVRQRGGAAAAPTPDGIQDAPIAASPDVLEMYQVAAGLGKHLPAPVGSLVVTARLGEVDESTGAVEYVRFEGAYGSKEDAVTDLARWCLVDWTDSSRGPWFDNLDDDADEEDVETAFRAWIAGKTAQQVVDRYVDTVSETLEWFYEIISSVTAWNPEREVC